MHFQGNTNDNIQLFEHAPTPLETEGGDGSRSSFEFSFHRLVPPDVLALSLLIQLLDVVAMQISCTTLQLRGCPPDVSFLVVCSSDMFRNDSKKLTITETEL